MLVDPVFGLHSLGTMARVLSVSTPLEPLLETAAEEALRALEAASVSISSLEPGGRSLRTRINVGDLAPSETRWPRDEVYPFEEWGAAARVLAHGVTRVDCLRGGGCHPQEAELLRSLGKGSSVAAAIGVDGAMWGELYATRFPGEEPFVQDAVDYVDALVSIVGAAISRSLRETELAHLAFHDALTGSLNRHGLDEGAAHLFAVAEGTSRSLTTVALDINGLKQVNDHQGHARGDELIGVVAEALHEAFAPFVGSLVARVGGDEFVVLVPDVDPALVVGSVDAICRRAEGWHFGVVAGLSAGVSSTWLTGHADASRDALLAAADRALYRAKQQPLSAVVVAEHLTAGPSAGATPCPLRPVVQPVT